MAFKDFWNRLGFGGTVQVETVNNAANDKARKPLHRQAKTVASVGRASMQLAQLDTAILMAEMQDRPDYAPLYRLYKRMMRTDAQIMSGLNTRKNKAAKQRFVIRKNGKIDESLHDYFAKTWFTDFIRLAIEGQFYGISLVEFGDMDKNGEFTDINLIPREALVAHKKQMIVVGDDKSESTINYDSTPYTDWLIEVVNKDEPLGWFVIGARFNIIKGYTMTDWLRLSERYGMPTLAVESDSRDDKELDEMELQLSQFGSNGYIILPDGTKVSLLESSKADGFNVFLQLINLSDGYISKLMLGQTMTSDNGSSLSQAQVHKEILDEYTESDMRWLTSIVNDLLIPKLILHGYPLEGCKFEYYIFTPEYEEEIAAKVAASSSLASAASSKANNALPEKKKPTTQPVTVDNAADDDWDIQLNTPVIDFGAIIDDVVQDVYDSRVRSGDVSQSVAKETFTQLFQGIIDGYGTAEVDLKGSDKDLVYQLRNNVKVFSVFKSHSNIKEMTALLIDSDGKKKPWAKFKKEAEAINDTYNKNWLQTEFDTATGAARMAEQWQRFEDEKDLFPFLRYETVGDSRVRQEHKALDGIVLGVDDPFWNVHYPPNGWKCRCDVIQVQGPAYKPDTGVPEIPEAFKHNTGKSGKVWDNYGQYEENMPRFKRSALETYADVFMSNVSASQRVKAVSEFAQKNIKGAKFVMPSVKEGYITMTSNSQLNTILRRGVAAVMPDGTKQVLTPLKSKALLFLPDLIDRANETITKVNRHDGTPIDYVITDFEGWVTTLVVKRDSKNVPHIYDILFHHKDVFNKADLGKQK